MKTTVEIKSLFAYSSKSNKCSFYEFDPNVSIIYGRNTSGKSSVMKSIIWSFGINDGKDHLADIRAEEPIFRLDCIVKTGTDSVKVIFIREEETLFVKQGDSPVVTFNGILADQSVEHIKLKKFLSTMFNFSLQLESKNEYRPAPLEAMLLPYYISQAVGWVYIRKSFGNLDFYRNFKEDYLDYYLGIENFSDRIEKHKLEALRNELQGQVTFISNMQTKSVDLQITKVVDEGFDKESREYFQEYSSKQNELLKNEQDYLLECNTLTFYKRRQVVLSKVANHHKQQNPENGKCPICSQDLPNTIPAQYEYYQDSNDTTSELKLYKDRIKKAQSNINSLDRRIKEVRSDIGQGYEVLQKLSKETFTMDKWLDHKANSRLIDNIKEKLGELTIQIAETTDKLKAFKDEDEITAARNLKNNYFFDLFSAYLKLLGVKPLEEDRFTKLYSISSFPYQGVELLKTIMAYHFAFNNLVFQTETIHRFPFILDAIFKEDITPESRQLIIQFISNNRPKDTQLILTISQDTGTHAEVDDYNSKHFGGKAKLIPVANGIEVRSFLQPYDERYDPLLKETLAFMQSDN